MSDKPRRSNRSGGAGDRPDAALADGFYEELQERWPSERPSRKRTRRVERRKGRRKNGQVRVRAERLDTPDVDRLSRALLAAQRDLAHAQAEAEARATNRSSGPDDVGDGSAS